MDNSDISLWHRYVLYKHLLNKQWDTSSFPISSLPHANGFSYLYYYFHPHYLWNNSTGTAILTKYHMGLRIIWNTLVLVVRVNIKKNHIEFIFIKIIKLNLTNNIIYNYLSLIQYKYNTTIIWIIITMQFSGC